MSFRVGGDTETPQAVLDELAGIEHIEGVLVGACRTRVVSGHQQQFLHASLGEFAQPVVQLLGTLHQPRGQVRNRQHAFCAEALAGGHGLAPGDAGNGRDIDARSAGQVVRERARRYELPRREFYRGVPDQLTLGVQHIYGIEGVGAVR